MKKKKKLIICLLLLIINKVFIFSQEEALQEETRQEEALQEKAWDVHVPRTAGENIKHGLIANAETVSFIGVVMLFNYLQKVPWALPTKDSIRRNFTKLWVWEDDDDFAVNQIGHPVQGIFSFGAGRANGFSFYQSVIFNSLFSVLWETLGESNKASVNDFITTSIGSMATGEMFYRLYLEACAAGFPAPLALIINPMVGLHRLISGWKPPNTGRNLELLQFHAGGSYAETHYRISNRKEEVFSFQGPIAEIGGRVIYGNPFEQESRVPYRQFEFSVSFGSDFNQYNHLLFLSDGYLLSYSPVYTDTDTMSAGLTMHFDFRTMGESNMEDSTIDQYSNALDWTVKYQHLFSENASFQAKLHSGLTFFGSSEYYANLPVINDVGHIKRDYKNWGAGFNNKWFITFKHNTWGWLEIELYYYLLLTYPGTTHFSHGTVNWLFADIVYTLFIKKHVSVGFHYSISREWGSFSNGFPNTRKSNDVFKMYVAWNM